MILELPRPSVVLWRSDVVKVGSQSIWLRSAGGIENYHRCESQKLLIPLLRDSSTTQISALVSDSATKSSRRGTGIIPAEESVYKSSNMF